VGDVTQPAQAKQIVAEVLRTFGKLDILVCNVGSGRSVPPGNETADEWQRVFALNLWSTTNIVEAARDELAASKGVDCLYLIHLRAGSDPRRTGHLFRCKGSSSCLCARYRPSTRQAGVRINAVAPGNILFDGSVWSRKIAEDKRQQCRRCCQRILPSAA
jgi:3-oxoacyl-[acyl-carrier protein] reductase